jgi:hypothetical protein
MAKLPAGSSKKNYITDKKTGKPLSMDTKNPQEAGVGSVGKAAIKLGFKAIEKIANTKPGVKATKAVAKKVQTQAVKSNKKTVEKVAKMQEATKGKNVSISKAEAKALKAAQGKSLASPAKKIEANKNAKERLVAKNIAKANIKVNKENPKKAYGDAAKAAEAMKARDIKFAKNLPNTFDKKTMKNVKIK